MTKKTPQEVAAYIRAIVKNEVGTIRTKRKISEEYHWYVGNSRTHLTRRNAWRYKYYKLNLNDYGKAYEAYKLINGMAPKLKEMFGYTVVAQFSRRKTLKPSFMFRVTPANNK
jgi:hypothetical protein